MAALREGQQLGNYRIIEPLGRGGMARVYRAYHPHLDRYVAVKTLRNDLVDDEEFFSRFQREARAVAALRHTNIVQVYDFDVADDGESTYMVMELLEGDTLKVRINDYRIRGERMPLGEVVRIMLDVLDGLAYAHSEGMIHRDIKPANILLTRKGQAVLADFGIAQMIGGTRHTVSGALMGTLNYMAPEQGLENKCDVRSDLYSMGVVLYEMLTQQPPFDADTPLAILMKHLNDPLPLPSQIDPAVPEPLERVVLKTLSKNPDDRYQSAEAMADSLRQAAKKLEMEMPLRISMPLSFTTTEAPGESVAIFSGSARKKLAAVDFAEDETDVTLGQRLKAEETKLAQENSRSGSSTTRIAMHPDTAVIPPRSRGAVTRSILNAGGLIAIGNMVAIALIPVNNGAIFSRGWPFELFLLAIGIAMIMRSVASLWLFIPAGIIFGNGLLMAFYSLTNNWHLWIYLWPLEPAIIFGVIYYTINRAHRQDAAPTSQYLANRIFKLGRMALIFITLYALFAFTFN